MYDVAEDARLKTEFALNVVGTTQFPSLVISGIITSEADGTASKWHLVKWAIYINPSPTLHCSLPLSLLSPAPSLYIGNSDFERMEQQSITIDGNNNATSIRVFPVNDEITLEYDDRVFLRFTPALTNLFSDLSNHFEYIRDTAVVNIIDNDRKCPFSL